MATNQVSTHPNAFDWSGWRSPVDICSVCGERTMRPTIVFDDAGKKIYCRRHIPRAHKDGTKDLAKNSFANFTLDHVRDEQGKKVTVNSIAELRAAEKRYNFALAVASDDGGTAANPPQHEPWAGDITHDYKKKFNLDPEAYKKAAADVDAGVVGSVGGTLVERPNKTGTIRKLRGK